MADADLEEIRRARLQQLRQQQAKTTRRYAASPPSNLQPQLHPPSRPPTTRSPTPTLANRPHPPANSHPFSALNPTPPSPHFCTNNASKQPKPAQPS
ncbi:hypothetical protein AOQ84DRAFT_433479, partial [Glonium stellatum]